jgi:hypothetical protein
MRLPLAPAADGDDDDEEEGDATTDIPSLLNNVVLSEAIVV